MNKYFAKYTHITGNKKNEYYIGSIKPINKSLDSIFAKKSNKAYNDLLSSLWASKNTFEINAYAGAPTAEFNSFFFISEHY